MFSRAMSGPSLVAQQGPVKCRGAVEPALEVLGIVNGVVIEVHDHQQAVPGCGQLHDSPHLLQAHAAYVVVRGPGPDVHEGRMQGVAVGECSQQAGGVAAGLGVEILQFFGADVQFGTGADLLQQRRPGGQVLAGDANEQVLKHVCRPTACRSGRTIVRG